MTRKAEAHVAIGEAKARATDPSHLEGEFLHIRLEPCRMVLLRMWLFCGEDEMQPGPDMQNPGC